MSFGRRGRARRGLGVRGRRDEQRGDQDRRDDTDQLHFQPHCGIPPCAGRDGRAVPAGRGGGDVGRRLLQDADRTGHLGRALVEPLPAEQLVEHHAEREEIRRRRGLFEAQLLRRLIAELALDHARLGELRAAVQRARSRRRCSSSASRSAAPRPPSRSSWPPAHARASATVERSSTASTTPPWGAFFALILLLLAVDLGLLRRRAAEVTTRAALAWTGV